MKGHIKLPELDELKIYLKSFDFFSKYVRGQWEGDLYVESHARRFVATLKALPSLPPAARVLEVGAIPYYMTILLRKFYSLRVDPLSFFEAGGAEKDMTHVVESQLSGERFEFLYRPINVEKDIFPVEDKQYDLVVCCEILEHLLINPSHMLAEIHRALRPDGYLLVTTPNVARWGNVLSLAKGRNIYDRYHGNGTYGRHNREYTPDEVTLLLEANSFDVERNKTINVYGSELVNKFPRSFINRGDNIFALARARPGARMSFPASLYVLMDQYQNPVRSALTMGVDELNQIGRGWYDFEEDPPGFRWTSAHADFALKNQNASRRLMMRVRCHHPRINQIPVTIELTINGEAQGAVELTDHSWHDVGVPLKTGSGPSVLNCRIGVSRTWIPRSEEVSADDRALGVAVSRVWLA